ncbi:snRNA-activating protein complex subunit 1-like [Physella acuta]|uniref:snRNA-activating protein complex subunit 1-like n=1 Tax=Physella acuta TaxID=109671 RepID=UPI0027DAB9F5|nr:snRNA-activating protein complex subunit 1-like [Physella acuta]
MSRKSYTRFYQPIAGIRTDFKRLINSFLELKTVRYEAFSEIWRSKNMSFLCAGRCSDRETREFIEKILLVAQEYFLPPFQFQVRVGGLYLLYGIFQIQPLLPKVRIRVTSSQWKDIVYFQQQAAQQHHLDVVYVFNKLIFEQAFHFCYSSVEVVNSCLIEGDDNEMDLADDMKEENSSVNQLFVYESIEKLSYLQDQYQRMKVSLAGPNATKPDKSLDVVHGEFVGELVDLLQSYKEEAASILKNRKDHESTSETTEENSTDSSGGRRQMLKALAYSHVSGTNKPRHNIVVETASTNNSSGGGASSKHHKSVVTPEKKAKQNIIVDAASSTEIFSESWNSSNHYKSKGTPEKSTQGSVKYLHSMHVGDPPSDSDVSEGRVNTPRKRNPMVEKLKSKNRPSSEPSEIVVSLPKKRGPVSRYMCQNIPSSSDTGNSDTGRHDHQMKSVMKKTKPDGEPSSLKSKGNFSQVVSKMVHKKKHVGFNLNQEKKTVTEIFVDKNIGEDAVVKSVVVKEPPKFHDPNQILKESASSSESAMQKLKKKSTLKINNVPFEIKDEVDEKGDKVEKPKRNLENKVSSPKSKKQKVSPPPSAKPDPGKKVKIMNVKFI